MQNEKVLIKIIQMNFSENTKTAQIGYVAKQTSICLSINIPRRGVRWQKDVSAYKSLRLAVQLKEIHGF